MQPGAPAPGQQISPEQFTMVQPATVGAPIAVETLQLRNPAVEDPTVAQWQQRIQQAMGDPAQARK